MSGSAIHNAHLDGSPFFFGGGPVGVLLVHGFTATPVEVRSLAERLHAQGHTVAGPLLPGHGTRPEDLNRVRWQDWVSAAEETYGKLADRCERVFIGGESMGGLTALYLASQHPEAAGVMAYAPAIKVQVRLRDRVLLTLASPFVPWRPKPGLDQGDKWQGYQVDPLRGAMQLFKMQREMRRRLPLVRQPVLVVQGRLDSTVDPMVGEIILQGVGSDVTEMHWMEQSDHIVLLGPELDEVTALTLRFMARALATYGSEER